MSLVGRGAMKTREGRPVCLSVGGDTGMSIPHLTFYTDPGIIHLKSGD